MDCFGMKARRAGGWRLRLVAAVALATSPVLAWAAGPSSALSGKAPQASALLASAGTKGTVRVIIDLSLPSSAAALGTGNDAALRASVRSVVDPFVAEILDKGVAKTAAEAGSLPDPSVKAARTSVSGAAARATRTMPFLPLVATDVSAADLERIAADPRVKRIVRDGENFATLSQSIPQIGGVEAFAAGATGTDRVVAILDSGVQMTHPFFGGRVQWSICHSTNTGGYTTACPGGGTSEYGNNAGKNCTIDPDCDHGTHVAGIAAGALAGGTPPRGVAPGAKIFSIQVFSKPDVGRLTALDSDIIAGLQDVYGYRTVIPFAAVNMSLGGDFHPAACDNTPIATAIDQLRAAGIATVISAGNDSYTGAVSYPGCVSSAITVGATSKSDVIADFTNMSSLVDVMAPGIHIVSSIPNNTYVSYSGTSMAAPHVSGAFAALKSAVPAATVSQIESALETTGVAIVDNRLGGSVNKPRIDIYKALLKLKGLPQPPSNDVFANAINVVPSATSPTVVSGTNVSATLEAFEPRGVADLHATVWWKFTATRTETVQIRTTGSPFDTTLGIYKGLFVSTLTAVTFNDDNGPLSSSQVTFPTTAGQTYYVQVGGLGISRGTIQLAFDHPAPANDNFASATLAKLPTAAAINVKTKNDFASIEAGEPKFLASVSRTIWFKIVPTTTRAYLFGTKGSSFDTTLALYSGTALNALTLVASNDDSPLGGLQSRLSAVLTAGKTYYMQLGGVNGTMGTVSFNTVLYGPANDLFANAIALSGTPGTVTGSNVDASVEAGELLPLAAVQGTVWWRYTATSTKNVSVSTTGSGFDTTLAVMVQGGPKGLTMVAFNDDDGALTTSRVGFQQVSGRTYFIQVGGYLAARGAIKLAFPALVGPLAMATGSGR